jgi:phosphoribosylformylglycinamidine synthase
MVGADITLPAGEAAAAALFGEAPSRVVIAAHPAAVAEIERRAKEKGVPALRLGTTGGPKLVVRRGGAVVIDVALAAVRKAREECLSGIVGA